MAVPISSVFTSPAQSPDGSPAVAAAGVERGRRGTECVLWWGLGERGITVENEKMETVRMRKEPI